MQNSNISWTDHTFNPWIGCTKVSEGCQNCYAAENFRFKQYFGPTAERHVTSEKYWEDPLRWNNKAEAEGVRYKVFCGSMCDVFEDREELLAPLYQLGMLIRKTKNLDWLLLTKRPELWMRKIYDLSFYRHIGKGVWRIPDNVWLGVSVENQEQADKRIPELLKIPAKVRFLSCEPLLEVVEINGLNSIDWVIAGGESGKNRREMDLNAMDFLQWQCDGTKTPFFCKQDSAFKPGQQGRIPDWLWEIKEFPK